VVAVTALVVLTVIGVGAGGWLILTGWRSPVEPQDGATPAAPTPHHDTGTGTGAGSRVELRIRAVRAAAGAVGLLVLSRWPTAAVAGGLLGWFAPELFASRSSRDEALARTEAIASWTEMLRDTISSAHGLEAAITTTAPVAPAAIRPEVQQLSRSLKHTPLSTALRRLAADLAHPISDLVVASLTVAANGAVRDLAELLGLLADSARDEAAMQMRVEASRARMRTAVRVISTVTVVTAVGLVALNRSYVEVYATLTGQIVLAGIAAAWGAALWWLASMSRFRQPERFLIAAAEGTGP
jgi:hypothetical protein